MEETTVTQEIDFVEIILNTVNSLCQTLFSSIDKAISPILDDLIFINQDIAENKYLEKILGTNPNSGLLILANALLLAFLLYYAIRRFSSFYNGQEVESPYQFFIRAIIIGIFMNFSLSICSGIVSFTYEITEFICELGNQIFHKDISLSSLFGILCSQTSSSFNFFSIDGILTSMLSISSFTLVLQFSFRYIIIKILILLSPFAILCLLNRPTSGFFRSWLKSFFSLLLIQIILALILLLPFAIIKEDSTSILGKILLIRSVYALLRSNQFVKEFINGTGISTDFNSGISRNKIIINALIILLIFRKVVLHEKIYISLKL